MLDWQTIDTVLLDLDGTLLDLHFDNYFWLTHLPVRYAEIHGIAREEAEALLHRKIDEYRGTLQWYCLDHWSELVDLDIVELKREIQHKIRVRPHTQEFLIALKAHQKQVILVTNAHRAGLELKLNVTGIEHHFDTLISSHDYQEPKESDAFWLKLSEQVKFSPETSVFIDDTPRILASAQKFGIKHLVCMTQPDSQHPPKTSGTFLDIIHFDEIMPR